MESEIRNKNQQTKIQAIVTITTLSILIISVLFLFGIDFDGEANNWIVAETQTDTISKIGYVENSKHKNDETRIIGSFGNPFGNFDFIIDDPSWEFKDGTTITFTEIITTPTKCTNSITGGNFSLFDRDYKVCMSSQIEEIFKVGK